MKEEAASIINGLAQIVVPVYEGKSLKSYGIACFCGVTRRKNKRCHNFLRTYEERYEIAKKNAAYDGYARADIEIMADDALERALKYTRLDENDSKKKSIDDFVPDEK